MVVIDGDWREVHERFKAFLVKCHVYNVYPFILLARYCMDFLSTEGVVTNRGGYIVVLVGM